MAASELSPTGGSVYWCVSRTSVTMRMGTSCSTCTDVSWISKLSAGCPSFFVSLSCTCSELEEQQERSARDKFSILTKKEIRLFSALLCTM